jgi:L-ascorbate metabolism protein UlaG (beta-lactamase superfamily)
MHHGRKRKPPVENLGFVVSVADQSILHVGDTELSAPELAAIPWAPGDVPVDVALIPYWLLLDDEWEQTLTRTVQPTHVVAMHLPRPDAPSGYFGGAGSLAELVRTLREEPLPSLVLDQPGNRQIMTVSSVVSSNPS